MIGFDHDVARPLLAEALQAPLQATGQDVDDLSKPSLFLALNHQPLGV